MYGVVQFSFGYSTINMKANAGEYDSESCTNDMKKIKEFGSVECERLDYNGTLGTGSYLITIKSWPLIPQENNLFAHSGSPDLSQFSCNTTQVDFEEALNIKCELEDVVVLDLPGLC